MRDLVSSFFLGRLIFVISYFPERCLIVFEQINHVKKIIVIKINTSKMYDRVGNNFRNVYEKTKVEEVIKISKSIFSLS